MLQDSEDEQGVLDSKDTEEPGARLGGAASAGSDGVAQHHHLGM